MIRATTWKTVLSGRKMPSSPSRLRINSLSDASDCIAECTQPPVATASRSCCVNDTVQTIAARRISSAAYPLLQVEHAGIVIA